VVNGGESYDESSTFFLNYLPNLSNRYVYRFSRIKILVMNKDKIQENKQSANPKQTIHFLAIGDSLTKGVGDSTQNGGYVR